MTEAERYRVDKAKLRQAFERASASYDDAAVLQHEVGRRMLERLSMIKVQPKVVLDVGAGTGAGTAGLMKRYPQALTVSLDMAVNMLKKTRKRGRWWRRPALVCGDAEALPCADDSVDLLYSNLTLQWCHDLDRVFAEFRRVLRPGGLLMFTTFGPDTLKELRASWSEVDGHTHVNAFIDMHDIGDALVRMGFADPVMDREDLTLTYRDSRTLMREIKQIGASNVTAGRARGLVGKQRLAAVEQAYEAFRQADGLLPATYEVIYGHAWVTDAPAPSRLPEGMMSIPLTPLKPKT